jgi:predicted nucleic acid-binding protein
MVDYRDAMRAGLYRYQFARQGQALSTPDVTITALTYEIGATLVTSNAKHYPMLDI